jgi:GTPase SAR1 family protein
VALEQNEKEQVGEVTAEVIAETVSKMTGIPLTRLERAEAERLLQMEAELGSTVIHQDDAIKAIARAVRRSRSGLKDPRRPMGSFVFLGPSGVGKTYLCKQLAKFMFGSEDAVITMDMSEYMEKHNASRLVGAPPGYVGYEEGGQLTEKVRRRPYSVVLLDEIEKAHPDVFNMLLQIMEEGRLTDSFGRHVDFRNVILIMTSNLGSQQMKQGSKVGFDRNASPTKLSEDERGKRMRADVMIEVERYFRPEFLNRVDEMIVFNPLTHEDLSRIVHLQLNEVRKRLSEKGVTLELDQAAVDFLIKQGYSEDYGRVRCARDRTLHRGPARRAPAAHGRVRQGAAASCTSLPTARASPSSNRCRRNRSRPARRQSRSRRRLKSRGPARSRAPGPSVSGTDDGHSLGRGIMLLALPPRSRAAVPGANTRARSCASESDRRRAGKAFKEGAGAARVKAIQPQLWSSIPRSSVASRRACATRKVDVDARPSKRCAS